MMLFRAELLKLRRRPATYVVLAVVLVLLSLVYLGAMLSATDPESRPFVDLLTRFPFAYTFIVGATVVLGGLLSVAYGAAVSGADWGWGTLRLAVARGESRTRYVLLKFAALAVTVALGLLVCLIVGVLFTFLVAAVGRVDTRFPGGQSGIAGLPNLLGRGALSLILQASIGFAIASVLRSQLAGIGAGIALYFGQIFLVLIPGLRDVLRYGPFQVATELIPSGGIGGPPSAGRSLDPTMTLVLALAYIAIAVGIACLATERAEIRD